MWETDRFLRLDAVRNKDYIGRRIARFLSTFRKPGSTFYELMSDLRRNFATWKQLQSADWYTNDNKNLRARTTGTYRCMTAYFFFENRMITQKEFLEQMAAGAEGC